MFDLGTEVFGVGQDGGSGALRGQETPQRGKWKTVQRAGAWGGNEVAATSPPFLYVGLPSMKQQMSCHSL